jgi:hypothetical protein
MRSTTSPSATTQRCTSACLAASGAHMPAMARSGAIYPMCGSCGSRTPAGRRLGVVRQSHLLRGPQTGPGRRRALAAACRHGTSGRSGSDSVRQKAFSPSHWHCYLMGRLKEEGKTGGGQGRHGPQGEQGGQRCRGGRQGHVAPAQVGLNVGDGPAGAGGEQDHAGHHPGLGPLAQISRAAQAGSSRSWPRVAMVTARG